MSLFNVFDVTGSALSAQSVRLNVVASNLANADSVSSSTGETYRARHPVFETVINRQMNDANYSAGVRVRTIVENQAPLQQLYQPDHPDANEQGYIFKPNVNAMEEMANMIAASRAYQNNIEVMNASKEMLLRTLNLGQ